MRIIHRIVIVGAILSALGVWLLIRRMPDVNTGHTVLYMLFPGASIALALYCPCMVFNCLGRR
jgi:ABC-type Mn2+/Zn2+ transport system permease subunit